MKVKDMMLAESIAEKRAKDEAAMQEAAGQA